MGAEYCPAWSPPCYQRRSARPSPHRAPKAGDGATLSVVNPPPDINGMKVKRVAVTLNGYSLGECWFDRRLKNHVCTEPTDIEAGPHKVKIILDPLKQTYFICLGHDHGRMRNLK